MSTQRGPGNKNAPSRGRSGEQDRCHEAPSVRASQDPFHGQDGTIAGAVPEPAARR